jgi:hypothetical protein
MARSKITDAQIAAQAALISERAASGWYEGDVEIAVDDELRSLADWAGISYNDACDAYEIAEDAGIRSRY